MATQTSVVSACSLDMDLKSFNMELRNVIESVKTGFFSLMGESY
jgi:hypothetical protein